MIIVVVAILAVYEHAQRWTIIIHGSQIVGRAVNVEREQIRVENPIAMKLFPKLYRAILCVDVQQLVHKISRFMDIYFVVPFGAQFVHRGIENDRVGGRVLIDND
jgi:hypothetical protein